MPYFHVFISQADDGSLRPFMKDLSEADLKRRLIKPYGAGGTLVEKGEIVPALSLRRVCVVVGEGRFDEDLSRCQHEFTENQRKWNEGHRGVIVIGIGPTADDMPAYLKDVTSEVLNDQAPGHATRKGLLVKISENPLISTVVSGVISLLIGYVLGANK